jgi:hypothetical protein
VPQQARLPAANQLIERVGVAVLTPEYQPFVQNLIRRCPHRRARRFTIPGRCSREPVRESAPDYRGAERDAFNTQSETLRRNLAPECTKQADACLSELDPDR